mmetsp:Transcript_4705/g.9017  ORF Transcript_4705/g.9017 Transcript_4705/m.9017 type:complete len:297 (+) Transcript_4705:190-1080(+)
MPTSSQQDLLQDRSDYEEGYRSWALEVGAPPDVLPLRKAKRLHPGRVVKVSSLKEMESVAAEPEAKGIIFERQNSSSESWLASMADWVAQQEEVGGGKEGGVDVFAKQCQVVVGKRKRGADPRDVASSCKALVSELPPGPFRDVVQRDAEDLAISFMKVCPSAPHLTLQLEIIGENSCCRWHQDFYAGRMILTYTGPSTWMVDDADVDYDALFDPDLVEMSNEVSCPLVVPDFDRIHKPSGNTVMLIKGNLWPGIDRAKNEMGVVHKSPNVKRLGKEGRLACKRLVLKVDLSMDEP